VHDPQRPAVGVLELVGVAERGAGVGADAGHQRRDSRSVVDRGWRTPSRTYGDEVVLADLAELADVRRSGG
jgi:hypothetical protein